MKYLHLFSFLLVLSTTYSCDSNTTLPLPVLTTTEINHIAYNTAICGGLVSSNGGSTIISQGVCWNASNNPTTQNDKTTDLDGAESFISTLTGLTQSTVYYVRAYATTKNGTAYGNQLIFKTLTGDQSSSPLDVDGNVYHTVAIGTQVWMVENLQSTHYRDGSPITNISENLAWGSAGSAYCYYSNIASNRFKWGLLYNRYVAVDPRNIAPIGWHVPTDVEWFKLQQYLGGQSTSGGKLKEWGTSHWQSPNTSATNSSGFTAIPSGWRNSSGSFMEIGTYCCWWSSGGWSGINGWGISNYNGSFTFGVFTERVGLSIRCIRD